MSQGLRPHSLSLRARFVIFVLAGVAVVATAMAFISHHKASQALLAASKEHIQHLAQAQASELARRMASVAAAPRELAITLLETGVHNEGLAVDLLREHVAANKRIFGMALALEPYSFSPSRRYFSPYVYREGKRLKAMTLDNPKYDYAAQNWYLIPALLKRPVWSEPYYDEGGGGVLMTTYSAPMVKQNKTKGVVTSDVGLADLAKEVRSLNVGYGG